MKKVTRIIVTIMLLVFPIAHISSSQWGSKEYTLPKVGGWDAPKATTNIPQLQVTLDLTKANIKTNSDEEIVALLKRMFLEKQGAGHYWGTSNKLSYIGEQDIEKAYKINEDLVNFIVDNIKDSTSNESNRTIIEQRRDTLKTFLFKLFLTKKQHEFEKK